MFKTLFILFISPAIAFCDDGIATGIGKQSNTRYSLILGDYNAFDQQTRDNASHLLWKYGMGHTHMQMGNNFGLNLSANTGFAIGGVKAEQDDGIMPFMGIELLNGQIQGNTAKQVQDFYQGFVGPSTGVQVVLEKCRAMALIKGGGGVGTLGKTGLMPQADLAYGWAGFFNCGDTKFGISTTYIGQTKTLHDNVVLINFTPKVGVGFNYQEVKGLRNEANSIGFMRWRY